MGPQQAAVAVLAVMLLGGSAARAQDPVHDVADLNGLAFANARGNVAVNAAAGVNNQQANIAVVAEGDASIGAAALVQVLESTESSGERQMSALITNGAFANSSGLIAVNVAAGTDNQQGNLALISIAGSGGAMADIVLSQSRASRDPATGQTGAVESGTGQTLLSQDAFENSSGVVQLSIIGGERNSSANLFALSIQGSANP